MRSPPTLSAFDVAEYEDVRVDVLAMLQRRYGPPTSSSPALTLAHVAGGLWNLVISVESAHGKFVYKRYRPTPAPSGFPTAPASATELFETAVAVHRLAPTAAGAGIDVPELVAVNPERLSVLMRSTSPSTTALREHLQGSGPWPSIALAELARWLARYHRVTHGELPGFALAQSLERYKLYKTQMQYNDVALRLGGVARRNLEALGRRYAAEKTCLVHGDLNSANVLAGDGGERVWVIDFEQAHVGTPAFDISYLLSEVMIAGHHRAGVYEPAAVQAGQFIRAYQEQWGAGSSEVVSEHEVVEHLLGQILYRFWGPSSARWTAYTSPATRAWFERRCEQMLNSRDFSLTALDAAV